MTAGLVNSTNLAIYSGAAVNALTKLAYATSGQISFSANERDVTTKDDTDRFQKIIPGLRQCTISTGGLVAWDAANGVDEIYDAFNSGAKVIVRFSTEESGDTFFEGEFYVTSLEINSEGTEENVTWSATFKLGGTLTKGTVA